MRSLHSLQRCLAVPVRRLALDAKVSAVSREALVVASEVMAEAVVPQLQHVCELCLTHLCAYPVLNV